MIRNTTSKLYLCTLLLLGLSKSEVIVKNVTEIGSNLEILAEEPLENLQIVS